MIIKDYEINTRFLIDMSVTRVNNKSNSMIK